MAGDTQGDGGDPTSAEDAELVSALLDAAADAVVVSDADGRITRANAAAGALFGHDPAALVGRGVEVLMPEAYASRHAGFMSHHLRTGERRIIGIGRDVEGLRADGTVFPLHLAVGRADAHGRTRFVAILRDLTRRRATEAALARSERMDAIGRMTGGIAHDFNNLLTIVTGNLELLAPALDDDDRALLTDALEAAELGAQVTARLLAFARRGTLEPERLDPGRAVRDAISLLGRTLGPRIAIEAQIEAAAPIEVDRAQLQSALINLAINARDAMPDGGRLHFEVAEAVIDDDYLAQETDIAPGRYVRVSVADTGQGMDAATRTRALEPFFTTKPKGQGTGFGLAMVYGFVRQSGGHVTLYSEVGRGTTVGLYFPLAAAGRGAGVLDGEGGALPRGRGERVLVVEDDPAVRRLSIARVSALGYEVEAAETGDEALARLAAGPAPDLVFTDLVMPGSATGLDVVRHVEARMPGTAAVLTSGYSGALISVAEEDRRPVLRKPFRQADLAVRLRDALDGRAQPRSTSAAKE